MLPSVSFGALLVSYPITSITGLAPTFVAPGFSAPSGVKNTLGGSVAGGVFTTGTTSATSVNSANFSIFSLSNVVSEKFQLERVEFSVKTNGGGGFLVISSDATSPAFSTFGATGAVNSASFVPVYVPYSMDALAAGGTSMTLRLYTISSNGSPFTAEIDSIDIYGKVVPEPTSLAIFGCLGLGALVRLRKRFLA